MKGHQDLVLPVVSHHGGYSHYQITRWIQLVDGQARSVTDGGHSLGWREPRTIVAFGAGHDISEVSRYALWFSWT